MKIFNIPNTEKFLNIVEKSRGDVTLLLPGREQLDLKHSLAAKQLFRIMSSSRAGLSISLSDSADIPAFVRYMMEARINNCPDGAC